MIRQKLHMTWVCSAPFESKVKARQYRGKIMFIQGEYPAGLELLKMVKYIFFNEEEKQRKKNKR
jgi:hypothetical protein